MKSDRKIGDTNASARYLSVALFSTPGRIIPYLIRAQDHFAKPGR